MVIGKDPRDIELHDRRLGSVYVGARDGNRLDDRRVLDACCDVPVAVTMGGGYCPDIDTIVTIHANTVRDEFVYAHTDSYEQFYTHAECDKFIYADTVGDKHFGD